MKPLLAILAHSGASDTLARHWDFYEHAGLPILGVDREDTITNWPDSLSLASRVSIGKESYVNGTNHLDRYLNLITDFLNLSVLTNCTHLVVQEYDAIWLRPCPPLGPGFTATVAGHRSDGFLASNYYHTPWICDRPTAEIIERVGPIMLDHGLTEHGFLDRWLGLLVELYSIPTKDAAAFAYCRNTIDRPEYVAEAREAIKRGCAYIHGIKTAEQLKAVTEGLI